MHASNGNSSSSSSPPSPAGTRAARRLRGLKKSVAKRKLKMKKKRKRQAATAAAAAAAPPPSPSAGSSAAAPATPFRKKQQHRRILDHNSASDSDFVCEPSIKRGRPRKVIERVDAATQTVGTGATGFIMSHQQLLQMQLDAHLSTRQMACIMSCYNKAAPAHVRMHEPHFRVAAVEWNKLLFEQFKAIRVGYDDDGSQFRAVFPVQVGSLFKQLAAIHKRVIRRVQISCDAGRSFLKVVATIEWNDSDISDVPAHSRERVIVLAILPMMKESYDILKDVFHRINFPSDLSFVFIGDLKVLNICLGLSTSSSANPCPFCEQCLLKHVPMKEQLTSGKLRTYRSVCSNADKYDEKTALVDVASCIHHPLDIFKQQPDVHIDKFVGHPGMHYMLVANWIIKKIEQLMPPEQMKDWYEMYHFVRPSYFNGDFEGNQIRHLLRHQQLRVLRELISDTQPLTDTPISEWNSRPRRDFQPSEVEKYFQLLVKFSAVVRDCFGMKLKHHWQSSIDSFKDAVLKLNIARIPTKFHIIISHVPSWCLRHNAGLATVSDQWGESIHHDWRLLWENSYKVKHTDSDVYAAQLHRCVAALNARHIPLDPASFGRGARFEDTNPGGVHEGPSSSEMNILH